MIILISTTTTTTTIKKNIAQYIYNKLIKTNWNLLHFVLRFGWMNFGIIDYLRFIGVRAQASYMMVALNIYKHTIKSLWLVYVWYEHREAANSWSIIYFVLTWLECKSAHRYCKSIAHAHKIYLYLCLVYIIMYNTEVTVFFFFK